MLINVTMRNRWDNTSWKWKNLSNTKSQTNIAVRVFEWCITVKSSSVWIILPKIINHIFSSKCFSVCAENDILYIHRARPYILSLVGNMKMAHKKFRPLATHDSNLAGVWEKKWQCWTASRSPEFSTSFTMRFNSFEWNVSQLLDRWKLVQIFMFPSGWIEITMMINNCELLYGKSCKFNTDFGSKSHYVVEVENSTVNQHFYSSTKCWNREPLNQHCIRAMIPILTFNLYCLNVSTFPLKYFKLNEDRESYIQFPQLSAYSWTFVSLCKRRNILIL